MSSSNARFYLAGNITAPVREALGLPDDVWQLAINGAVTLASYMDGRNRVHHLVIDDLKRHALQKSLGHTRPQYGSGPSSFERQTS